MDLKNAMKNTWTCLEHFHGSLKTTWTMPQKIQEPHHENILGISGGFNITENPCQHFQSVIESD